MSRQGHRCRAGHELGRSEGACRRCRVELVAARVAEADSDLSVGQISAAIDAAAANPAALAGLAKALALGPGPLTVGAPPAVGRLVVELRARGSVIPQPTCARCGRSDRKLTVSEEGGVCPMCRRRQLAVACSACGGVKPVAGRDGHGAPLCAACAPRPRRTCSGCGRVRVIARRARGELGDLCDVCYREPTATCGVCRRQRPCHFVAEGRPVCVGCSPRRSLRCAHCDQNRPPTVRWPEGPVCEPCYRAALARRGTCEACGAQRRLVDPPGPSASRCADCAGVAQLAVCRACGVEDRPYRHGACVRCALAERARQLIGPPGGPLEPVYEAITAAAQPYSAHNWLRSSAAAAILAELSTGTLPLTHEALDAHPRRRGADYLRHLLTAHGILGPRDDALARLETWVTTRLHAVEDPEEATVVRSYATWRVLRRARQRAEAAHTARTPTRHAKTCLNTAIAFIGFLHRRGHQLSSCTQTDIDTWLTTGPPSAHQIADFVDWAAGRNLMDRYTIPGPPRRHSTTLDNDARWAILRRLLHDDSIELTDRVAGSLVLLYGQQLSRIVGLTRDQITTTPDTTRLRLGVTRIDIPEPLAGLLNLLATTRRPHTGVCSPTATTWLFPGLDPGLPITAYQLGQRLRRLGIDTNPARRSALTYLAAHLPAAVLADLVGLAPTTAVRWVHHAGSDWTTYAAQLIHSNDREP